eukprot:CAMPEP_0184656070 /NCGR_PEP_ID=MMETSP0308-20130426/15493_1 /TAXON_ID=38269 /ORGANISM="Gloeochaete witrockiana, Strain SAG 46.84" /LENGTH=320 /DNA_ID=CAMNT_0027092991 /DNA_START=143 /DNA_END=1105 /DNA_ORIENTATION=-
MTSGTAAHLLSNQFTTKAESDQSFSVPTKRTSRTTNIFNPQTFIKTFTRAEQDELESDSNNSIGGNNNNNNDGGSSRRRDDDNEGDDDMVRWGMAALSSALGFLSVFALDQYINEAHALTPAALQKQLSEVPVFVIVDSSNKPVLCVGFGTETEGKYVVTFMARKDALEKLKQMKKPGLKVLCVGMDNIYKLSKSTEEGKVTLKFVPTAKQLKNAVDVLQLQGRKVTHFSGTPIFQAEGLTMRQGSDTKQYIPLFFSREDLEAAWAEMRKGNPSMSPQAKIEVGKFEELTVKMEESDAPEWTRVVFFAPKENTDYVQSGR